MGKPAARLGDMTAHGGAIVGPGVPTVLIGGMPAATIGDMHVCPMITPGVPPIPHVGGAIVGPGVPTVLIGGKPVAVMGDMAICIGPPATIVGGCPTVLIGMGGGGGGAGGAGSSASASVESKGSAVLAARMSAEMAGSGSESTEDHFFEASFMDKEKLPITGYSYELSGPNDLFRSGPLGGTVKLTGIDSGEYELGLCGIVTAKWGTMDAEVGDIVDMTVITAGIGDGVPAKIEIFVKDSNFTNYLLKEIETEISGDEINETFSLEIDDHYLEICDKKESKGKFSNPLFFFKVTIDDLIEQSGILRVKDWIGLELYDSQNQPIKSASYKLRLVNGAILTGNLDSAGKAKVEKVTPGNAKVEYGVGNG